MSCVWLLARAETPPHVLRTAPTGFSHPIHAADVTKKGDPEVPCTRCHSIKNGLVIGKPNHAACFGTCHGAPPTREPVAEDRMRFCNTCHAETALATPKNVKGLAVAYPPYVLAVDHAVQLGHKAHATIACDKCHAASQRGGLAHKRCVACHNDSGKTFAIAACASCHVAELGGDRPRLARKKPTDEPYEIFVTSAFSHAKHASRGAARQCATCHPNVVDTDGRDLPRPIADGCAIAGCHDGKASFGITATCTKCHKDVPKGKFKVARSEKRFSHLVHDQTNLACVACHPLAKSGEVLVTNHASCSSCHAADFGKREPAICGSCHNGTEPWRPLVPDRLPAELTEFGATLDHGKHPGACSSCHSLATTTSELRPPRGHSACSTAKCHAVTGGPSPKLGECESCHQRGLADQRDRLRHAATWSVRATFVHASHRTVKGVEVECTTCHTDMTSQKVLSLAAPSKQTCAKCHDVGKVAFKLTANCTRCHPGSKK